MNCRWSGCSEGKSFDFSRQKEAIINENRVFHFPLLTPVSSQTCFTYTALSLNFIPFVPIATILLFLSLSHTNTRVHIADTSAYFLPLFLFQKDTAAAATFVPIQPASAGRVEYPHLEFIIQPVDLLSNLNSPTKRFSSVTL